MNNMTTKKESKQGKLKWWVIVLIIMGVFIIIGIVNYIREPSDKTDDVQISLININTTSNENNKQVNESTQEDTKPKTSVFETTVNCKDSNCYNLNLETCKKTIFTKPVNEDYITGKLTREIKGITNGNCVIYINYKYVTNMFGTEISDEEETTCNIPLRNGKYYLFDYEVPIYCDNKDIDKTEVAEPEQICVSLKQFPITKYFDYFSYIDSDIEYEVKYKPDSNAKNPIVDGFEITSDIGSSYSDSVFCHKGNNTGENVNYWYCGDFKLIKTILDNNGTVLYTQYIYANSVFDSNLKYVKTICMDSTLYPNWILEIN